MPLVKMRLFDPTVDSYRDWLAESCAEIKINPAFSGRLYAVSGSQTGIYVQIPIKIVKPDVFIAVNI
jgi:hypothetical protein